VAPSSSETTGNGECGVGALVSRLAPGNNVCTSHVENGAEKGSRISATSQTAHTRDSIDGVLKSKTGANHPATRHSRRQEKQAGFADTTFAGVATLLSERQLCQQRATFTTFM